MPNINKRKYVMHLHNDKKFLKKNIINFFS